MAATIGMGLVFENSSNDFLSTKETLSIPAEKIFTVSINGFGNEYSAELAGFTKKQIDSFNQHASLHRIVVKNVKIGDFDLVSQLGGDFSGTDWILPVEVANGLGPLHRLNFGGAEGIDNIYGDLTLLKSGDVPKIDHATIARNLFWLDTHLQLPNNPVSLSWASYVALLTSKPGEGSAGLSAALQSVSSIPKPLADVIGVIPELVLRALPITHAAQALQFLTGAYLGGQLIGSLKSSQPFFDINQSYGPEQTGWYRQVERNPNTNVPVFVIDTNPLTRVMVIRQIDGRSIEIHPDGSQIQPHPEYGVAYTAADGHGTLFFKGTDGATGDALSATVVVDAGSTIKLESGGWRVLTPVDQYAGVYQSVLYRGMEATFSEIQFNASSEGSSTDKLSISQPIVHTLAHSDAKQSWSAYTLAAEIQQTTIRISPEHIRVVLRDSDRRIIQTIDSITTDRGIDTRYHDWEGRLQQRITIERLNTDATRTSIYNEAGSATETTLVQRYRRGGEIYDLEDHTDFIDGSRLLTVRDSLGRITKTESVPIGAISDSQREVVRDQLDSDIADFLTALRQNNTLNIILSAARIALDYSRAQGITTLQQDALVNDVSSGLALVTSLRSIQSSDMLAKIGGAVGLLSSSNYLASRLVGSGYLNTGQLGALSQIGAILSVANLANLGKMIEAGRVGSAGASVVSAVNSVGYLSGASTSMMGSGAIIAINPIVMVVAAFALDSLFGSNRPPPPPQATATFYHDNSGVLRYRISAANPLGEQILRRELDVLVRQLEHQLVHANSSIKFGEHRLALVAARMPTIQIASWPSTEGNGVDNYFFVLQQRDPARNDSLTLALARQDLVRLYGASLLVPEAIVQGWEIEHLRMKFGPNEANWQTEGEWLRGHRAIERQRAQLQAELDRATSEWKATAQQNLSLTGPASSSHLVSNVSAIHISVQANSTSTNISNIPNSADTAYVAMTSAE